MDILRVLSAPDLEVRKKTLNLALDLVSSRNIEEVSEWCYNLINILFFFLEFCFILLTDTCVYDIININTIL